MIIPNLGFGGAQRIFRDLSESLSSKFDVYECAFNLDADYPYRSSNPVISLDVSAGKNILQKTWNLVMRVRRLKKVKNELEIDLSISHLEGADYVNLLSAGRGATILCIHGSKIHDKAIVGVLGWVRKKILIPFLYNRADRIVAVVDGIANELQGHFGVSSKKISVINNGFDLQTISLLASDSLEEKFKIVFDRPALITHGRCAFEKNQAVLIKLAAQRTLKDRVNVVIIGDGPQYQDLVKLAFELGLSVFNSKIHHSPEDQNTVFFLGYQANPFAFLRRATIFVFPSLYEGFPLALVEAMACGLPVVARDCPYGPREILNGEKRSGINWAKFGVILGPDEGIDVWAECIDRILSDRSVARSYGTKALGRSHDFTIENFRHQWFGLLNAINVG
jgi:glycosyltransferase involved in cell wall biosynthesis